jgi:hypothetical protein
MLKRKNIATALVLVGLAGPGAMGAPGSAVSAQEQAAQAKETWQKDFDDVCSKTQDAMILSIDELTDLVRKCDVLMPQIEKLDETRKKVFMGRLKMCRSLYAYVLESKKNEKK